MSRTAIPAVLAGPAILVFSPPAAAQFGRCPYSMQARYQLQMSWQAQMYWQQQMLTPRLYQPQRMYLPGAQRWTSTGFVRNQSFTQSSGPFTVSRNITSI